MKKGLLIIMGIALLNACAPKPQPISRGYRSNTYYHKSPARTYSGPNSGNYYKK
jgi:hypothetical protein